MGVTIQLTLPPQPVRAAWWQSTLLIDVAWVWKVKTVKPGADCEFDSCPLLHGYLCGGGHALDVGWVSCIQLLCRGVPLWLLKYIFYAINTVTQCTEHFNIPLCPLWFELNYCPATHSFFHSPAAPIASTPPWFPSRSAPPALVVVGWQALFDYSGGLWV